MPRFSLERPSIQDGLSFYLPPEAVERTLIAGRPFSFKCEAEAPRVSYLPARCDTAGLFVFEGNSLREVFGGGDAQELGC